MCIRDRTSRKKQYQLITEHGIVEKENFTEVDSLDFSNARIVFQGVEGAYCLLYTSRCV